MKRRGFIGALLGVLAAPFAFRKTRRVLHVHGDMTTTLWECLDGSRFDAIQFHPRSPLMDLTRESSSMCIVTEAI